MTKRLLIVIALSMFVGSIWFLWHRFSLSLSDLTIPPRTIPVQNEEVAKPLLRRVVVEPIVSGLFVPWSMVFTSDSRMLVSERSGSIREVVNGALTSTPLITFDEVVTRGEGGLLGLTLHPNYQNNSYVYAMMSYETDAGFFAKIERLIDRGDRLVRDRTIIDTLPAAVNHSGGRIAFGPDGMLYVTTGDALDADLAQSEDSLAGKILRMTDEGSTPDDNPLSRSYIYSLGHRNPQGLAWSYGNNQLVATEHGPSVFDGPAGGDEINIIKPLANYGWPLVSHERNQEGLTAPAAIFTPAVAPASALFYSGNAYEAAKNHFFFGGLRGEGLFQILFDESITRVEQWQKVPGVEVGRVRDVIEGPDGFLYISTSNRDGRGTVVSGDDHIYRVRFVE